MATITPNEHAPADSERYDLASDTIFVKPGESVESNDPTVVANALVHPWLDVEGSVEDEAEEPTDEEPEADAPGDDSYSGIFAAGDDA